MRKSSYSRRLLTGLAFIPLIDVLGFESGVTVKVVERERGVDLPY